MIKTKKWWALFLAIIMVFSVVPSIVFAENFRLISEASELVADQDTRFYTVFTQDPNTKRITATVQVYNGNPTETIVIGYISAMVKFTGAIAPVHKTTGLPYYGDTKIDTTANNYGNISAGCPFPFSNTSTQIIQNIAGTGGFIGLKVGAPTEEEMIRLAPGATINAFEFYFMPADGSSDMNLNMFSFDNIVGPSLRRASNWIANGSRYMQGLSGYGGSGSNARVNPDAFKIHMAQQAPKNLSVDHDGRTVINYDPATMEWATDPAGPYDSTVPVLDDEAQTIYVRMKATEYSGQDTVYVNYKKLLASDPVALTFSAVHYPVPPEAIDVTKTAVNKTSTDGRIHVNDTIEYTVKASNNGHERSVWANAVMTDVLKDGVTFKSGTVKIDGVNAGSAATYNAATRTLTVNLGNIPGGEYKEITFEVTVDADAYGKNITNSATVKGKDSEKPDAGDIEDTGKEPGDDKIVVGRSEKPVIKPITEGDEKVTGTGVPGATIVVTFEDGSSKTTTVDTITGEWEVEAPPTMKNGDKVIAEQTVSGLETSEPAEAIVGQRPEAGLKIDKTSENKTIKDGKIHVNDTIGYTLAVTNTNSDRRSIAKDVVVTDTLRDGITFVGNVKINGVDAGAAAVYNAGTRTLTVTLGEIAGGVTKTVTFEAKVDADAHGKDVTNTASVAGKDAGSGKDLSDEDNDDDGTIDTNVVDKSKKPDINPIIEGDDKVTGKGEPGATIEVTFPDGSTEKTKVDEHGNWEVPAPPLTDGQEVIAEQTVPGLETSDPEKEIVGARPDADLNIDKTSKNKTSTDGKLHVNDLIEYTIVVSNDGDAKSLLTGVVVEDKLPDGITLVDGSIRIEPAGGTANYDSVERLLTITLPDMLGNTQKTITFQATIDPNAYDKEIINSAKVSAKDKDKDKEDEDDDDDGDDKKVVGKSKMPTIDEVNAGDRIISGTGVPGAKITVILPVGGELTDIEVNGSGYWKVDVPTSINLVVGQTVKAVQTEPDLEPSDPAIAIVQQKPAVVPYMNKTSRNISTTDGKTRVGDTIEYTITVKNEGLPKSLWTGVVFKDVIPEGVTLNRDSVLLDGQTPTYFYYTASTRTLLITMGNIAGGTAKVVTFEATVDADAGGKLIVNSASVEGKEDGSGNTITDETTEEGGGNYVTEKSDPPTVDDVTKEDDKITGKGEPGAEIIVTLPDGTELETEVDEDGNWSVDLEDYVPQIDDEIIVIQIEDGKDPSDEVITIVKDKDYRAVTGLVNSVVTQDWGFGEAFLREFDIVVELRTKWNEPADSLRTIAVSTGEDDIGQFTIENVPFGTYVLYINRPGYLPRYMTVEVRAEDPDVITVAPPGDADEGIFKLWWGAVRGDLIIEVDDVQWIVEKLGVMYGEAGYEAARNVTASGIIEVDDAAWALENLNKTSFDYAGAETVDFGF